jgi:rhodanese-related sulfurtransferase
MSEIARLLEQARSQLRRLSPDEARDDAARGAVLVDIRSDPQRAADGLIPGAIYVPRNVLEWRADPSSGSAEPALGAIDTKLILICHEGYQSSLAAATLHQLGRAAATDVIGGFVAWRDAGLPVKQTSPK